MVLPLIPETLPILTLLISPCTHGSTPYTRDSTILTVLISPCIRGSTAYTRDSTILIVLISPYTRDSIHSSSVN